MPPKKKRAPPGPKLAPPIPAGTKLPFFKTYYTSGAKLGSGGFGTIYFATKEGDKNKKYALKMEYIDSGPLFCEFHFYAHVCKIAQFKAWLSKNSNLSKNTKKSCNYLPIPEYVAHGKHTHQQSNLRWLVMPYFAGGDLHSVVKSCKNEKLPRNFVNRLAIQMIHALKYMHDHNYAHADIKGMNILLDKKIGSKDFAKKLDFKAYLVDFGLVAKFDETKTEYKPDKKKAGDGTIEYTSIDAHVGVKPNPRADFEILYYCLVHWATGYPNSF